MSLLGYMIRLLYLLLNINIKCRLIRNIIPEILGTDFLKIMNVWKIAIKGHYMHKRMTMNK